MSMKAQYPSPESAAKAGAAWLAAKRLQQFVYGNISFEVSIPLPHAMYIVKGWEEAGKVRRIAPTPPIRKSKLVFEVIPEDEIVTEVTGDAYEQMWTIMRKFPAFTPVDLAAYCAVQIDRGQASSYCQMLLSMNYLKVVQKGSPGKKEAIYQLVQKTGVKAPRERRVRCLIDPNTRKIMPLAGVGE